MMNSIFNTLFETSIRIILLLNNLNDQSSLERIVALDFVILYGKDFEISSINLNGDNKFSFSEYALKRELISKTIKELVLKEYLAVHCKSSGFKYSILPKGREFCKSLNNQYCDEYNYNAKKAIELFSKSSDRKIIQYINNCAKNNGGK